MNMNLDWPNDGFTSGCKPDDCGDLRVVRSPLDKALTYEYTQVLVWHIDQWILLKNNLLLKWDSLDNGWIKPEELNDYPSEVTVDSGHDGGPVSGAASSAAVLPTGPPEGQPTPKPPFGPLPATLAVGSVIGPVGDGAVFVPRGQRGTPLFPKPRAKPVAKAEAGTASTPPGSVHTEDEAMPDARVPWPGLVENEDGFKTYPAAE